jgi:hypothetical protein
MCAVVFIISLLVGGIIPLLMPPYKNNLSCQAPFSLLSIMYCINIVLIMFISKKHLVELNLAPLFDGES